MRKISVETCTFYAIQQAMAHSGRITRNKVLAEGAEFLTSYVNLKTAWNWPTGWQY
jgi:hypothetical protein